MTQTALTAGSPQQVIERVLTYREHAAGDFQRQLFNVDGIGVPHKTVLEQIEFLGEIVPVLREEFATNRPAHVPEAPLHPGLTAGAREARNEEGRQ